MASSTPSKLSDTAIERLESYIPEMAAGATHAAYVRALAAGHTVMSVQGSQVVASSAEGATRVVSTTKPRRKVTVGQVIQVRCVTGA